MGAVYFCLFLAHGVWRVTLHNNAVNNFGLDGDKIGILFSINYLPGVLCVAIGLVATRLQLYRLTIGSCLLLACGLLATGVSSSFAGLAIGTLLIAFGFTFFYTVANATYLITSSTPSAPVHLSALKSLGPLAGLAAAMVILLLFAPNLVSRVVEAIQTEGPGDSLFSVFRILSARPEVDASLLRVVLVSMALLLLALGWLLGRGLRLRAEGHGFGTLRIRRQLLPYYALNFLAGCRSAIFQSFALLVMVREYQLPIHGTAALVLAGYIFGFLGYRATGLALLYFSHRAVLRWMYGVVACNFFCFWFLMQWSGLSADQALAALALLFIIDSTFFGISVVTDSHLKHTGRAMDYVGDVGTGMTLFSLAAVVTSFVGGLLWQPLGGHAFLLGSLVCLAAIIVGGHLRVTK
jgi:hypothetical protein